MMKNINLKITIITLLCMLAFNSCKKDLQENNSEQNKELNKIKNLEFRNIANLLTADYKLNRMFVNKYGNIRWEKGIKLLDSIFVVPISKNGDSIYAVAEFKKHLSTYQYKIAVFSKTNSAQANSRNQNFLIFLSKLLNNKKDDFRILNSEEISDTSVHLNTNLIHKNHISRSTSNIVSRDGDICFSYTECNYGDTDECINGCDHCYLCIGTFCYTPMQSCGPNNEYCEFLDPNGGGGGIIGNPILNEQGFFYSRIAFLDSILISEPFSLEPCDSLNIMPLNPESGYGNMWQRIAQYTPPTFVKDRIDSIKQLGWITDYFNYTNLTDAFGSAVNCDFFPVRITQLPTGFTAQSLVEYFRININSFIDTNLNVKFKPYFQYYTTGGVTVAFTDTAKYNSFQENSVGSIIHINMFNDGSVVESEYYHNNTIGSEKHRFKFTTMVTPLDYAHPVAGNREFGIYSTPTNPNEFTFYTMGVDRINDWEFALGDWVNHQVLGNESGFENADKLWSNFQKNMKLFINTHGGQAQDYSPVNTKARPKWNKVKDYLKGDILWTTLKQLLGC